jgi:hypothetical protein
MRNQANQAAKQPKTPAILLLYPNHELAPLLGGGSGRFQPSTAAAKQSATHQTKLLTQKNGRNTGIFRYLAAWLAFLAPTPSLIVPLVVV